jgi:hypothetical protein
MLTQSLSELEGALQTLSLDTPLPQYKDSDVLNNPLDLYRSYLAKLLCSLVDCEPSIACRCINWPNNIFNGDLTVVLPKLRPNVNPNESGTELLKKVGILFFGLFANDLHRADSSNSFQTITYFSYFLSWMASISEFS